MNTTAHIVTRCVNGVTRLQYNYASPPLKIANITENRNGHPLHLMLMSSSPGILDGDRYNLHITAGANSRVLLGTQSYQRLFTMQQGASQHTQVNVEPNAMLVYLPHPTVPHRNAVFTATNHITMATGSALIWGEVITCGRKQNGEQFQFSHLQVRTDVHQQGKLILRENMLVQPATTHFSGVGLWQGYTHQASCIFIHPNANVALLKDALCALFLNDSSLKAGVTTLPANGCMVRLLGHSAEKLFKLLQQVSQTMLAHCPTLKTLHHAA